MSARRKFPLAQIVAGAIYLIVALTATGHAQTGDYIDYEEAAAYPADVGNRQLIDIPTAYTLPRGSFDVSFAVHAEGALIAATNIGLSEFLMVGFSYGANGVFSQNDPIYHPSVEFSLKWRLTEEGESVPALAIGFTSQGSGPFLEGYDRLTYKPKGFYGVFSKTRSISGYEWTAHGGVNYSIGRETNVPQPDRGFDFFGGLATEMRNNLYFAIEYNAAFNDDKSGEPFGRGRGYLNAALKWVYFDNLQIEFTARDLLGNRREAESFERGLKIVYLEFF